MSARRRHPRPPNHRCSLAAPEQAQWLRGVLERFSAPPANAAEQTATLDPALLQEVQAVVRHSGALQAARQKASEQADLALAAPWPICQTTPTPCAPSRNHCNIAGLE